ncbi:MAG TPA: hypothetical protein VFT38_14500 [Vicinamibacteria bacterium]|nr:hypothetical protein [Vicinamibacteria bacterium]
MIHDPEVALTDYALAVETAVFAVLLWRQRPARTARRVAALIFACLCASSVTGGSYHGFFPGGAEGPGGGWAVWIATMLVVGVAASLAWIFFFLLLGGARGLRIVVAAVTAAFLAYAYVVVRIDHSFRVSAIASAAPVLALLVVMLVRAVRDGHRNAMLASAAILLMLAAAVLQQLHVGLHPVWFNHNALYHLLEGIALAVLFVALRAARSEAL